MRIPAHGVYNDGLVGGWGGNGGLTLEAECVGLGPCGELHHLLGVVLELLLQLWAAVGLERASGRMNTRRTHIQ